MGLIVQLVLAWFTLLLTLLERLLDACRFETWLSVFDVSPNRIFRVQDSAVLILNAEDGIGQTAALKYSELGYTVFALCPDHQRGISVATRGPSSVSSILYFWHLKKERSPDHPWGLIAPIVVDISSKADRLRAYETVKAYCSDHSLHLTALIAFPPIYETPSESTPPSSAATHPLVQGPLTHLRPKFLPLSFSKDSVWQDSVFREITEPVLIIQEYIRLLKDSSGRVIIVSGCSQGRFLSGYRFGCRSTLDEARRSIAHSVGCELKPFGVKVSSLVSGLLAAPNLPAQKILDELNMCAKRTDPDIRRRLGANLGRADALESVHRLFTVTDGDLLAVIQRITNSRHPKVDYYIGVHPFIRSAWNALAKLNSV
ncbi:hypothetical protein PILCRDRAFT_815080 [Piloderma croceum F 1598]|uniref:Ketoreductase (KR) domain-containing protein n=1 Tax=Piloderma croceum (strain F 1598) TaxID=765440 RepID=A0A0C3GA86_PILCF|nr:hypothetical protein PILCRDRAFT_815080 [Piloderma croceum F 1598]